MDKVSVKLYVRNGAGSKLEATLPVAQLRILMLVEKLGQDTAKPNSSTCRLAGYSNNVKPPTRLAVLNCNSFSHLPLSFVVFLHHRPSWTEEADLRNNTWLGLASEDALLSRTIMCFTEVSQIL